MSYIKIGLTSQSALPHTAERVGRLDITIHYDGASHTRELYVRYETWFGQPTEVPRATVAVSTKGRFGRTS